MLYDFSPANHALLECSAIEVRQKPCAGSSGFGTLGALWEFLVEHLPS